MGMARQPRAADVRAATIACRPALQICIVDLLPRRPRECRRCCRRRWLIILIPPEPLRLVAVILARGQEAAVVGDEDDSRSVWHTQT